jgi:hypothetical protein
MVRVRQHLEPVGFHGITAHPADTVARRYALAQRQGQRVTAVGLLALGVIGQD